MKPLSQHLRRALERLLRHTIGTEQAVSGGALSAGASPLPVPCAASQGPMQGPEWSRVPLVTGDPLEAASAASERAAGSGMGADLLALSLHDLAGFTTYARRLAASR